MMELGSNNASPNKVMGIGTSFDLIYFNSRFDTRVKSYNRLKVQIQIIKYFVLITMNSPTPLIFFFSFLSIGS